jgi:hypothetical protein
MFETKSKFPSVRALLDDDMASPMDWPDLDDELWFLILGFQLAPSHRANLPIEVLYYYGSRLVQWEVGNGGFLLAASGVSEWFPIAAEAYDALGYPAFSRLIRQAAKLPPVEDDSGAAGQSFEALDAQLAEVEWEVDEQRIAYVRLHRDKFKNAFSP